MFKNGCRLILLIVLTVTGCSIPFFDRAEIVPGPRIAAGIGMNTGYAASGNPSIPGPISFPPKDYYLCLSGTLRLKYGFSEKVALVLQGSAATGIWLTGPADSSFTPSFYDLQCGAKFRTGKKGALQTTLGFPGLLDIWYIYDFNRFLTGTAGIGLRGIAIGLTGTLPLNRNLSLHIGANLTSGEMWGRPMRLPAASLGIGLGYKPGR